MPPLEWHQTLKEAREARASPDEKVQKNAPLIFDCRNDYETAVGVFEGADPLDTENFRESWGVFADKLKDTPKDAPIMTYCTGGIRCVKVGAYLTQEMGFTNVSRLAGGIIAYDRALNEEAPDEEPMFKGTNYVFDGRVGRQITDDALGDCITCQSKTNLLSNCMNANCHRRMVQCDSCRESYLGSCSDACKNRVVNSNSANTFFERESPAKSNVKYETLDDYSLGHSTDPGDLYDEIKKNTAEYMGSGLHMISDAMQGRLLCNIASMAREGRVLEIGGFTGYATCCFLEGSANAADAIGFSDGHGTREKGPFVMSLERDGRAIDIAASHLDIMTKYGVGSDGAKQASTLRGEGSTGKSSLLFLVIVETISC
jgi:rhodanese-related sulfurtransferase